MLPRQNGISSNQQIRFLSDNPNFSFSMLAAFLPPRPVIDSTKESATFILDASDSITLLYDSNSVIRKLEIKLT